MKSGCIVEADIDDESGEYRQIQIVNVTGTEGQWRQANLQVADPVDFEHYLDLLTIGAGAAIHWLGANAKANEAELLRRTIRRLEEMVFSPSDPTTAYVEHKVVDGYKPSGT